MAGMFRFKQFSVDQTGCAMKINTDGVLLGAVSNHINPKRILDIGAGTGVIALMLAQKFNNAQIDAVEIDTLAAETAGRNFENSAFCDWLHIHSGSINDYFSAHLNETFDLIVSNPPFYINSLESPEKTKKLAKHTDINFFGELLKGISMHLTKDGSCWLILPIETSAEVKLLATQNGMHLQKMINIRSYEGSAPHREIVCLGFKNVLPEINNLTIYTEPKIYTTDYLKLLQPYFLAF